MEPVHGDEVTMSFPLHEETSVHVNADLATLFDHLDDPRRLGGHMEKPSWRTLGSAMRYSLDEHQGRSVGSVITLTGQIVGAPLYLREVVCERSPPQRKAWQTTGQPHLIAIGGYRMGFEIAPDALGSTLTIFIDYELGGLRPRWLGRALGRWYARWCVNQMARDAQVRFSSPSPATASG
ncbi:MAG TPA: SRPBCC family protein [Burkholderiaceae bacterium]|nr:SRPBCC family protein [Burkholderiaceae bacterium]